MELDWSTFLLEIVNFLVLLWILKRFLYRPVLDVIEKRRLHIEAALSDAEKIRAEAYLVKDEGEKRLEEWRQEKALKEAALQEEVDRKRATMMEELARSLADERNKAGAIEEQKKQEWQKEAEARAAELAGRFAARLLERLVSPELEEKILALTLAELSAIPVRGPVEIESAFGLPAAKMEEISAFFDKSGEKVHFRQNPELVCGLRLTFGASVVEANIAHELEFFRRTNEA